MSKNLHWCPNCHQDTLFPTGRFPKWDWATPEDSPPIDAAEFEEWECRNPVCEEAWRKMGQGGPWRCARKKDGAATRDPRWTELIKIPRKEQ